MAWLAGVLQGFLPIYPTGLSGAHQDSGVGCPYWWLQGLIHPKYVLWGCSLVILQTAPSWWRCPAEGYQGLPKHGQVWRYRLGSGNYQRNVVWQIALRCFTKCLCRAHWWGIFWGAPEAIWYHREKLPRRVLNHHQLGLCKPVIFAGTTHQVNDIT